MINPGDIYRINGPSNSAYHLLAIEVVRSKAGYDVWSLLALDGPRVGTLHHGECYWLANQQRVT